MSNYLKLRGNTWYSNIPVPADLRESVGKFAIVRTLGTSSLGEAKRRLRPILGEAEALFDVHRGNPNGPAVWRHFIASAKDDDEREALEIAASNLADKMPEDRALRFASDVFEAVTMASATTEYLGHVTLKPGTVEKYKQAASEFPPLRLDQITAASGREYLAKLQRAGLSLRTRRQRLTILGVLWRGFRAIGLTDLPSPFDGLKVLGKEDPTGEPRAFTDEEVLALAPKLKPDLREHFALALITGARVDELAHLWRGNIDTKHRDYTLARITHAKTKSSVRDIPVVHPLGRSILAKWAKERTEEIPQGRASKLLSNRFTNAKQGAGLPAVVDFHSTRRYWTTRAEVLALDPIACARYVGHAVKGMTFGLYSKGHQDVLLRVAKGYTLPAKVERALKR